MNNGKEICERLKEVRREIAKANEIRLVQPECTHKGDCMGTCPRCEQEVRYLEGELSKRRQLGKAVSIVGIAAIAGTLALTSCVSAGELPTGDPYVPDPLQGDVPDLVSDTIPNDSLPEGYAAGIAPVE